MRPLYGYHPGTKKHRGCPQQFDRKHIKPHWWKQRKKFSVDGNHHHKTLLVTDEVKLNQKTSRERVQPRITKKKKKGSWEKSGEFPVSDTEEETIAVIESQGST